jgi:uncharacterized membrane protein
LGLTGLSLKAVLLLEFLLMADIIFAWLVPMAQQTLILRIIGATKMKRQLQNMALIMA